LSSTVLPYAHIIIRLLQGVIYADHGTLWNELLTYATALREYFRNIGVELFISETEGFACLQNREQEDENEPELPELFSKRQLSYPVTLLCVLLLEKLIEFDLTSGDSTRLILTKDEIKETFKIFFPVHSNEARLIDTLDTHINKLVDYGFLKGMHNSKEAFEVKRILKAKITADKLGEIKKRLEEYCGKYDTKQTAE
jgi:hypothetical protein